MTKTVRRWGSGKRLVVLLFALGGCNVQAPQLDALRRDLKVDPRERLRVYDACRGRSRTPADLDDCMTAEGYRFLSPSAQDYRASECWDDRYRSTWPPAYCYDKEPPR